MQDPVAQDLAFCGRELVDLRRLDVLSPCSEACLLQIPKKVWSLNVISKCFWVDDLHLPRCCGAEEKKFVLLFLIAEDIAYQKKKIGEFSSVAALTPFGISKSYRKKSRWKSAFNFKCQWQNSIVRRRWRGVAASVFLRGVLGVDPLRSCPCSITSWKA